MRTTIRIVFAHHRYILLSLLAVVCLVASSTAFAQSTIFTYQGKLSDNNNPASGQYDFQFKLYDTATVGAGTQQGAMVSVGNVTVTSGIFTVQLDFVGCASCFNGSSRFLEIAVKQTSGSTFTTLGPRQAVTSNPYAIRSLNSMAADGLSVACVNCVTSSQIGSVSGSAVSGAIPVPSVPAGSGNYIQNTTSQQATSNFNISGNGTAGGTVSATIVNATTQFNLNGNRVFQITGVNYPDSNTFAGVGAGASNQPGDEGFSYSGHLNSFFGNNAGLHNTIGFSNSFFGTYAGFQNTTGFNNSSFGYQAGFNNTTGTDNSFFGKEAGYINSGSGNSFFGSSAGYSNTTGSGNTMVGILANVGANNLNNATAIGSRAQVGCDNCLVLGSINGFNGATANTKVGIGTTAPEAYLQVRATPLNPGSATFFSGTGAMINSVTNNGGSSPAPPETLMVLAREGVSGQAFANFARFDLKRYQNVGTASRSQLDVRLSHEDLFVEGINTPVIMSLQSSGNVGIGVTAPMFQLQLSSDSAAKPNGGSWSNPSDLRLKENIHPFTDGLAVLRQINPVSYRLNGKAGLPKGEPGIGVIAQEVRDLLPYTITTFKAKLEAGDAEPAELLAFNSSALTFVLINAVKELSARMDALHASNKQVEITALKQENEAQKLRVADLEARLAAMEQMMKKLIEKP